MGRSNGSTRELPSAWELIDRTETALDRIRYLDYGSYTGSGEKGSGVSLVVLPEHYLEEADDILGDYADLEMRWLPWGEDAENPHLSIFSKEAVHYLKEYEKEFDGHFLVDRTGRIHGHMIYVSSSVASDLDSSYDGAKMRSLEAISSIDITPGRENGAVDETDAIRRFLNGKYGHVDAPVRGRIMTYENPYGRVVGAALRSSTGEIAFLDRGELFRTHEALVPPPTDPAVHYRVTQNVEEELGSTSIEPGVEEVERMVSFDMGEGVPSSTVSAHVTDDVRAAIESD